MARRDRLEEAESLIKDIPASSRSALGKEHLVTVRLMNTLSNVYWEQRRRREMAALNVESVQMSRRVLGEDHRDTLSAMHNRAITYICLAADHCDANQPEQAAKVTAQAAGVYEGVINRGEACVW